MRMMGDLAKELEASGKMMSKAEKKKIMDVEKGRLEALKQEQFAQELPRVPPDRSSTRR